MIAPAGEAFSPAIPLLEARGIGKTYGRLSVLRDVDLSLRSGEMVALVGANGAGKSTLVKIICGAVMPDAGELRIDGAPVAFRSVNEALGAGVAVAHQQTSVIPPLTAAENIMLGREPLRAGFIRDGTLHDAARRFVARFGVEIDLDRECGLLSVGENKIIDILKALVHAPRVLILDEPTASLTLHETRRLFAFLRELRAQGICILFISHHLAEVFAECDRVVVLRDGRKVHDGAVAALTPPALARIMVGRDIEETDWSSHATREATAVSLQDARFGALAVSSLVVHRGEVVGLAGMLGAGQTALLEGLAGARPCAARASVVNGKPGLPRSVREAVARGVYLIADERLRKSLFPGLSVEENLLSGSLGRVCRAGFVRRQRALDLARQAIIWLRVKCTGPAQDVLQLSGGNQQKVAFGRWLLAMRDETAADHSLFLLDNPTEGVDVGSKAELYGVIRDFARQGGAVLIASAEYAELIALCDRIYCIAHGVVASCLSREAFSEDRLLLEAN